MTWTLCQWQNIWTEKPCQEKPAVRAYLNVSLSTHSIFLFRNTTSAANNRASSKLDQTTSATAKITRSCHHWVQTANFQTWHVIGALKSSFGNGDGKGNGDTCAAGTVETATSRAGIATTVCKRLRVPGGSHATGYKSVGDSGKHMVAQLAEGTGPDHVHATSATSAIPTARCALLMVRQLAPQNYLATHPLKRV